MNKLKTRISFHLITSIKDAILLNWLITLNHPYLEISVPLIQWIVSFLPRPIKQHNYPLSPHFVSNKNDYLKQLTCKVLSISKKVYDPFLWMGFNCLKATEPLRGDSLLFITKFPKCYGTNFLDLERMTGWADLCATQWFWTWDPWIRNPVLAFDDKGKITWWLTFGVVTKLCF